MTSRGKVNDRAECRYPPNASSRPQSVLAETRACEFLFKPQEPTKATRALSSIGKTNLRNAI
ncbi:hypothetical protein E2C01_004566 [Portunus trituberculatus]|uniref:Uncharacterized protein n=1 Tax=Portunus trituberculatus TaxID=210409 RepID=A0A5B7CSP1_PORTR|nr:hypothetical protein [Portunus trituberculatus]